MTMPDPEGLIFDIDSFAVHDGPGIRMAVYLKGCHLRCGWCHSPESHKPVPELVFFSDRCVSCGQCARVCVRGGHRFDGGRHTLDRSSCAACGECCRTCVSQALAVKGFRMKASAVAEKAGRMKVFFGERSGGVTVTGGEAADQPEFAEAVLSACASRGIHTTLETSGDCPPEILERLAQKADLVLYDLKLMDDLQHIKWTGVSNRRILANFRTVPASKIIVRVPLIPGITDTGSNVSGIIRFVSDAGIRRIDFLGFNPSASAKYEWLGRKFGLEGAAPNPARDAQIREEAARAGLTVGDS